MSTRPRLPSPVLGALFASLVVTAFACGSDSAESEFDGGAGPDTGSSGSSGASGGFREGGGGGDANLDSGLPVGTLEAIIRDFREYNADAAVPTNPDFENVPAEGGAIFASNHLAVVDSFFLPLELNREIVFIGTGLEFLWRTIVAAIASCFIIPIPWVYRWMSRWLASQTILAEPGAQANA